MKCPHCESSNVTHRRYHEAVDRSVYQCDDCGRRFRADADGVRGDGGTPLRADGSGESTPRDTHLDTDELAFDENGHVRSEAATAGDQLVRSVENQGVMFPVHARRSDTQLLVFDGMRRVDAAAQATETVPVLVYDGLGPGEALAKSLTLNDDEAGVAKPVTDEDRDTSLNALDEETEAARYRLGIDGEVAVLARDLEDVHGVGRATLSALVDYFGDADAVRTASCLELQRVPGVGSSTADAIRDYYDALDEEPELVTDGGHDPEDRPDPEDDPFACSKCGGYLGELERMNGSYCESCKVETEPHVVCEECGDRLPQSRASNLDVSPDDEYYPEFIYFCPTHAPGSDDQELVTDGGVDSTSETPDGWTREEIVAGMDTVGISDHFDEFLGLGSAYKCRRCEHYIPIDALDDDTCPRCEHSGMIGTVIMGRQDVTAMYPDGWFDDEDEKELVTDGGTASIKDRLEERLPEDQDAMTLLLDGKDNPMANARTLLEPIANSEDVVLKTSHPHASPVYFDFDDDGLVAVRVTGSFETELSTLDAIIAFAHAYGHQGNEVEPVPVEDAPEVFQG